MTNNHSIAIDAIINYSSNPAADLADYLIANEIWDCAQALPVLLTDIDAALKYHTYNPNDGVWTDLEIAVCEANFKDMREVNDEIAKFRMMRRWNQLDLRASGQVRRTFTKEDVDDLLVLAKSLRGK